MKITIHRGSNEIGGTCVEVGTGKTRLLLDLGMPLGDLQEDGANALPGTLGGFDAVLVSHPHQDHYGLIQHISPDIPVYMGELGQKFIMAARLFTGKMLLKNKFKMFKPGESFLVGDIQITPYLIDHSAADAYSFLVEGNGKRLFYSGDFRAHGRKAKLFERLVKNPPKNIDVLFMEGTMLGREDEKFTDERDVEDAMLAHLKGEKGASFLISSSQNIDRMVTAYRASKCAGRVFVVDIYTAWILKELSNFSSHTPTIEWSDVRALSKGKTAKRHYLTVKENPKHFEGFVRTLYENGNVITLDEIKAEPRRYFIKNPLVNYLIDELGLETAGVVYSQWKGYMSEKYNPKGWRRFKELEQDPRINFIYAHASGHAIVKDLQRFARALNPKILIPIHTEHGERFREYFENVVELEDGKELQIT